MEWIILSGSILVAAYFIYSAIQRKNDINERKLKSEAKQDAQILSDVSSGLTNDIIRAKAMLEDAQESGDKGEIKKAKEWLKYKQSELVKFSLAGFAAHQTANKNNEK